MAKNSKENPRMSIQQKAVLIEFLETHPNLVTGQLCKGFSAEDKSRLWSEITVILNDLGVNKGVSEWKGSWKDLKRTVKNKAAKIRETQKLQGSTRITPLTDLEERVIALIANNTFNGANTSGQETAQDAFGHAVAQTQENDGNLSRDEYSQEGVPFHLAPEVQMYPNVLEQPTPSGHMAAPHGHPQMYSTAAGNPDNNPQLDPRYKVQIQHHQPPHTRKRGRMSEEDIEHPTSNTGIAMTMLQEQSQAMSRLTAVLERQAIVQEEMLVLKKQRMTTQTMKQEEELAIMKQNLSIEQRKASAMEQIMAACLEYTKTH